MSEEKCTKCGELKSACKCKKDDNTEINIKVDTKNMETIIERLKEKEVESKKLAEQVKQLEAERKAAEDAKKVLEANNSKTTNELEAEKKAKSEYEAKLKAIEENELAEKRKVIVEKAKEVIKDEAKLKQIEDGVKDPASLKATEELVNTFYGVLKEGEKQHQDLINKEKEEMEKRFQEKKGGSGNIPLGTGNTGSDSSTVDTFEADTPQEAHAKMIRELRRRSHSDDPEVSAKAKSQIEALTLQWAMAVKKNFEGKAQGLGEFGPKNIKEQASLRQITKKGGEVI